MISQDIFINIYLFLMATVLALVEIQIEGKDGWAKNLPTWRPSPDKWYVKVYSNIMGGRELTGYHLSMFTFVFLALNLPYVFGLTLNLNNFLKTLSYYLMFTVIWDFLWFVLNPHYPLLKFRRGNIIWYQKWFLRLPLEYYKALMASLIVILPLALSDQTLLTWWILNIGLFILQCLIVILFTIKLNFNINK